MDRACSALNGGVGAEVEVILEGVSDIRFDESARESVGISVGSLTVSVLGEEADVMALCANDDSPLDLYGVSNVEIQRRFVLTPPAIVAPYFSLRAPFISDNSLLRT